MGTISFSTRPQKKYYSYKQDGCIYKISSVAPTKTADGGGVFYCFFKCMPYAKITADNETNTYLLYKVFTKDGVTEYEATSSSSFYGGEKYAYYNGSTYKTYDVKTQGYYTQNGNTQYSCPQSAAELPQATYNGGTYYFDTLIGCGDVYGGNKFTPMDTDGVEGTTTTYGQILLDKVEDSIAINAFNSCVAKLPEYLTGDDKEKAYTITSIGYTIPANYLIVYGELFMKKLNEYMKGYGDSMVGRYASATIETKYKSAAITAEVKNNVATLTTTPSTK